MDLNCRLLGTFLGSNMDDLNSPHKPDPGLWSSILVRVCPWLTEGPARGQGLGFCTPATDQHALGCSLRRV